MEKSNVPYFANKAELFGWLFENKDRIIAQKKAVVKHCDGIGFDNNFFNEKENAFKAGTNATASVPKGEIRILAAINTTNVMDSHSDVHMPGIWNKSLSENKMIMLLREHKMTFENIIADETKTRPYVKTMTWKELGFNFPGKTEVLLFDASVIKSRNEYMFDQYAKGYVKNHSVGMRYMEIVFCMDSDNPSHGAEKEAYDKYLPFVANADKAAEQGYFWVVKQAQVIEGSAVPLGSNQATPTISVTQSKAETNDSTSTDGPEKNSTQDVKPEEKEKAMGLDYEYLNQNLSKIFKN